MNLELFIQISGALLIALALVHVIFPRYFGWKEDLAGLQLINRQMMEVHTFFIALGVFLMGLLCLTSAEPLVNSSLGKRVSLGLAIFWGIRLVTQFFWYSPQLWRGKRFETIVHILFGLLWLGLTILFVLAWKR